MYKHKLLSGVLFLSILMSGCGVLPVAGRRNTDRPANDTAIAPIEAMPVLPIPGGSVSDSPGTVTDPANQMPERPEPAPEENHPGTAESGESDTGNQSTDEQLYRVTGSGILWVSISEEEFLN